MTSHEEDWDTVSEHVLPQQPTEPNDTTTPTTAAVAAIPPPPPPLSQRRLLTQLDVIVMDISRSMKSKSEDDPLQTREDISKVVFHTFVDKMICFEVNHGVALIAFASDVTLTLPVIEEYERFHDELGRLDATGSSTRLFDALKYAGEVLVAHYELQKGKTVDPNARLRVFALTDGEDNASTASVNDVTAWLKEHRVVVDAYPMACTAHKLAELCETTGGLSVNVGSLIEGLALFESEMMIHLADRPTDVVGRFPHREPLVAPRPTAVAYAARSAAKPQAQDSTLSLSTLQAQSPCLPQSNQQRSMQAVTCYRCVDIPAWIQQQFPSAGPTTSLKRIFKELKALAEQSADSSTPLIPIFLGKFSPVISQSTDMLGKFLLPGPKGSPYEGGEFVVNVTWPNDYPFKPPAVRFLTNLYHCNISQAGQVCLDILHDCWSPALTIEKVFLSLIALLEEPNADDSVDATKAMVYRNSKADYEAMAKAWTQQFASDRTASLAQSNMQE